MDVSQSLSQRAKESQILYILRLLHSGAGLRATENPLMAPRPLKKTENVFQNDSYRNPRERGSYEVCSYTEQQEASIIDVVPWKSPRTM